MVISCIVFDYENSLQNYHQRFIRDWGMVNKIDSKTLGHNNSIPLEPYLRWVRSRTQNLKMPYPAILLVIIETVVKENVSHIAFHPDMPSDLDELHKSYIQLKEERDNFEAQFYASENKVLELTK